MVIYSYFLSISPQISIDYLRLARISCFSCTAPLSDMINFIPFMFCARGSEMSTAQNAKLFTNWAAWNMPLADLTTSQAKIYRRAFSFKIINIVRIKLISFLIRRILLMNINRCTRRSFHIKLCTVHWRFFLEYLEYIYSFQEYL